MYMLSEIDVRVIKESLKAHIRQCEKLIGIDDKVHTFTVLERLGIEEKVRIIKDLLKSM